MSRNTDRNPAGFKGAPNLRMRPVLEMISRVAPSDANVLITGENGTGKGLIAQALHMGDEVHNRNAAASSLFLKRIVPAMLRSGAPVIRPRAAESSSGDAGRLNVTL